MNKIFTVRNALIAGGAIIVLVGAYISTQTQFTPKNINQQAGKVVSVHGLRVRKDIKQFAEDVDIIVIGTVKSINAPRQDNPGQSMVYSNVIIQVDEYLKNPQPAKELTIKRLGGKIGDFKVMAEDEPQFFVGEKVLLFLGFDYKKELVVYAGDYGKFSIENDLAVGSEKEKIKLNDLIGEIKRNVK